MVKPLNSEARKWVSDEILMVEREYVELLYQIRGIQLPSTYFDKLFDLIAQRFNERYNQLPEFLRQCIEEYERRFNSKAKDSQYE